MKIGLVGELLILGAQSLQVAAQDNQKVHGYLVDAVCAINHAEEPGYKVQSLVSCSRSKVLKRHNSDNQSQAHRPSGSKR
jgi:hypothetical protein